jgi:hypothetical protein
MAKHLDFFIIGVQKGGTTALDAYLRRHPSIQMSRVKEVHHFDNEQLDWSSPDHEGLHSQFEWAVGDVLRGEATPIYIYWPGSLARLQAYNPQAKLIVALRHPTFRAYSHWRMEVGRNADTLSFADAVSDDGRSRVREAQGGVHRVFSYVERGFYAAQIRNLFDFFPRANVHFLRTDRLWSDPPGTLAAVEHFLGVDAAVSRKAKRTYVVPGPSAETGELPRAVRLHLDAVFREDIQEAAALAGLDLSDWLTPGYREQMRPGAGRRR